MIRTNMTMSLDDSKSNFKPIAVWGDLAIISSSGGEKQSMLLDKCEYTIGRSRRCDVRISIKTVSRVHVRIKCDKSTGIMTLFNCGSEEDLFLNGTYVKSMEEVSLAYGDIINLSGRRFKLQRPRDECSVIVDETQLCSQPAILDKSVSAQPIAGEGISDSQSLWQRGDLLKMKDTKDSSLTKVDASPLGRVFGSQGLMENSPAFQMSDFAPGTPDAGFNKKTSKCVRFSYFNEIKTKGQRVYSPAMKRRRLRDRMPTPGPRGFASARQQPQPLTRIGTPDAGSITKTLKSVRFSYFNEIKTNGQRVYSPARKRRRLSHRMPTPGPRGFASARQLPQPLNRNISSKKRMSYQKQVINRTRKVAGVENLGNHQQVKTKLLLTPTVKGRDLDERRKAIMRRLLADGEVTNELRKFLL